MPRRKGKPRQRSRKVIFKPNGTKTYATWDLCLAENPSTTKKDWLQADSTGEYERFRFLLEAYARGEITELHFHPKYRLQEPFRLPPNPFLPKGEAIRKIDYEADFGYKLGGLLIIEDFKAQGKGGKAFMQDSAPRTHKLLKHHLHQQGIRFYFRIVTEVHESIVPMSERD